MKKNDWLVIGIALVVALIAYGVLTWNNNRPNEGKAYAVVYRDGEVIDKLPIDVYKTYTYEVDGMVNIVNVSELGVHIEEANCPSKDCIKQGEIHNVRESIVCLPHRFHVVIEGSSDKEVEIDAISK